MLEYMCHQNIHCIHYKAFLDKQKLQQSKQIQFAKLIHYDVMRNAAVHWSVCRPGSYCVANPLSIQRTNMFTGVWFLGRSRTSLKIEPLNN